MGVLQQPFPAGAGHGGPTNQGTESCTGGNVAQVVGILIHPGKAGSRRPRYDGWTERGHGQGGGNGGRPCGGGVSTRKTVERVLGTRPVESVFGGRTRAGATV